jgi:hypothetical protein
VIRVGDKTPRGYERADLQDAWSRYLPDLRNDRNNRNSAGQAVADESVLQQQLEIRNTMTSDVAHVEPVADTAEESG